MTKPDINPEDFYDEPDELVPVVTPLPVAVTGVTPTPGPADMGFTAGESIRTPGPPAVGPLAFTPSPSEFQMGVGGGSVLGGFQVVDDLRGELLRGQFDAFVGKVLDTYEGATHPSLGTAQGINVERIDVRWDSSTNTPLGSVTPSPSVGSPNVVAANPWPPKHDQVGYIVAEGDTVTVLRGADGLHWYMADDTPFVGRVVVWDDDNVTEQFGGGVDGGSLTLKVRQQKMTGNPNSAAVTLADLETVADAWDSGTAYLIDDIVVVSSTTYRCIKANTNNTPPNATYWEADNIVIHRYVNVLRADNQAHGYRVGDDILVIRRGLYLFALPLRERFLAVTSVGANSGPSNAADSTDEHYWVKELDMLVSYGTDNWVFADTTQNSLRSSTDPTGSGGRLARFVDAVNLAERAGETHLLADDVLVEVTMWQDASGQPYYTFDHSAVLGVTTSDAWLDSSTTNGVTDITVVGPSTSAYTGTGGIIEIDIDAKGWVRSFRACGQSEIGPEP